MHENQHKYTKHDSGNQFKKIGCDLMPTTDWKIQLCQDSFAQFLLSALQTQITEANTV